MNYEQKYLVHLIVAFLKGEKLDEPKSDIDWHMLYKYAGEQSLFNVFYSAVKTLENRPDDEVMLKLHRRFKHSVARYIKDFNEADTAVKLLAGNGIKVLPLKGYYIRQYYPQSEYRYISDLDIMCDNYDKACNILTENNYELTRDDIHHIVFTKNNFPLELHKSLFVGQFKDKFLSPFDNCIKVDGELPVYRMEDNYFYAYFIAHFAYHFLNNGIGLRSVLDTYYLLKNLNITDKTLIETCGLSKFEKEISVFALSLFEGEKYDENLMDFFFVSHTSGKAVNKEFITSAKYGKKQKIKRIFPSYDYISTAYPIKNKYQLPYFWAKRIISHNYTKKAVAQKPDLEVYKNKYSYLINKLGLEELK